MLKYNPKQLIANVDTLINQINAQYGLKIDINPEYQRDVIWDNEHQSNFIDSLMKGIAPMPILLCMNEEETGKVCMDGKQRLTSLVKFKENKIEWDGKYFKDLTQKDQAYFLNGSIHVIEYGPLNYGEQKEIFSRIQYGKPLSDGEKIISIFDKDSAKNFKKMCDDLYTNKLSKFKKIKDERDGHYIFMACVSCLIISNDTKDIGTKDKLEPILKKYFSPNQTKILQLMNFAFTEKLLLNSKILNKHAKVPTNRLIIAINEINKEIKNYQKVTDKKYVEMINTIVLFFDKCNKKKINGGRTKKVLDELLRLYNKAKNSESDSDSDTDTDSNLTNSDNDSENDDEPLPINKKIKS